MGLILAFIVATAVSTTAMQPYTWLQTGERAAQYTANPEALVSALAALSKLEGRVKPPRLVNQLAHRLAIAPDRAAQLLSPELPRPEASRYALPTAI